MLLDITKIIEQCKENLDNKIVFVNEDRDKEVSYNEIYKQIDKFSRCCTDISERKKVILQLEDTEKFVVAYLTFLLRGIISIPIDVAYKPEQKNMLNMICNSLDNVCILTDVEETKSIIKNNAIEIINYDELNNRVIDDLVQLPKTTYGVDDTALLMFSSGSTGNPKAVNITYDNIWENVNAVKERWNMTHEDCAVCWMPLTHAMGLILFQLTSMAASSDQVIIPTSHFVMNPQVWLEKMSKYKATISYSPNFGFRHTLNSVSDKTAKYDFSRLRFIVNAAEPISVDICNRFVDYLMLNGARNNVIVPLLGITEVTAGVTSADEGKPLNYYSIDRKHLGIGESVHFKDSGASNTMAVVDLGKPFSCCKLLIKDEDGNILPEDTIGHVSVGGKSVTLGYYQNQEATEASFVEGWLDSGDLGFIHGGSLVLTGRYKDVVIINGQNYYLQDIERVIGSEMPDLKYSFAAARVQTNKGESVAIFIETELDEEENLIDEIRGIITEKFGIDIAGVFKIKQLPKTRSGKILRYELSQNANVLPTKSNEDNDGSKVEKLDSELKQNICKIFEKVVGKVINSDENYFCYGLDSLKIMNLVQLINAEIGKKVNISDLYESKTVDVLMTKINQVGEIESKTIINSEHNFDDEFKPFGLTNIQLSYILGRENDYELGGVATHSYIELNTDVDISRMQKALNITIQKHPMLRVVFYDLTQVIQKKVPQYVIKVEDISGFDKDKQEELLLNERSRMSHKVFNPEEWPLFEVKALKHESGYYLLIGLDMLIMDANGMSMFAKDLFYYYQNPDVPVEKIDFSFRDYVINYLELKKSQEWENDRKYWLGKISEFNGAPTLPLKKDIATVKGAKYSRIETSISSEKWSVLKKECLNHNVTPSALLCTIYYEILSLWSNKSDFSINITTVNKRRFNKNVDRLLGDFTSSMILCISNVKNNDFWEKAQRIQKCIYQGLEHSLFDGVDFVRELSEREGFSGKAVLPVVFTSVIPDDIWGNWEVFGDINYSISQTSQVYLDYQASEKDGALRINWDYIEELLDKNMISDMFETYVNRLDSILDCSAGTISIPGYQYSLYAEYNDTKADISLNTLDGLFKESVEKYPDNIAVVDGDTKISYKELDKISNQIANKLIELKVQPKDMVCVSARRCYWSIANILGILKANAAYVPVDEDYPQERINYIINQSGSKFYLKPDFYVENKLENYDDTLPVCNHDLNDIAYVIFTSGSTGKPKGVVIAHGAASNTILDINNKFNVSNKDRKLQ